MRNRENAGNFLPGVRHRPMGERITGLIGQRRHLLSVIAMRASAEAIQTLLAVSWIASLRSQ
jgi:hypothetical protein